MPYNVSDCTILIRRFLASVHYCCVDVRPVGKLDHLGRVAGVGGVVLGDVSDVGVQVVVGLIFPPGERIRAALEQAGVSRETGGQVRVDGERQLLAIRRSRIPS